MIFENSSVDALDLKKHSRKLRLWMIVISLIVAGASFLL